MFCINFEINIRLMALKKKIDFVVKELEFQVGLIIF